MLLNIPENFLYISFKHYMQLRLQYPKYLQLLLSFQTNLWVLKEKFKKSKYKLMLNYHNLIL